MGNRDYDNRSDSDVSATEKANAIDYIEDVPENKHIVADISVEERRFLDGFDKKDQDRIFRKVDWRLVPMLALLYLISHLDRANIGNAKIEGLEDSLNMTGSDYNIALMIFFIPYVLLEVPSNVLLSKFTRPSLYIGFLVCAWGMVMTFSGFTQTFAGLVVCRFLVGVFEAGFFPAAIWLISQWYPPHKTQTRMALFYLSSAMAGAFSGLLAAGIAQMDGLGGLEGWRWIFVLEGAISVVIGVSCFFWLPDSPTLSRKWLSEDEVQFLELTHIATRGKKEHKKDAEGKSKRVNWPIIKEVVRDWQLYLQAFVFWSNVVPNYAIKFTMPSIIRSMGYTSTTAQLMTAPPYTAGALAAVVSALFADRLSWRMPFVVGHQALCVIAFSTLFAFSSDIANNVPLCYTMLFVACMGLYPIIPANNSWTINNLAGAEKRATGIAFMITMGNAGGVPGSFAFRAEEAPSYPSGWGMSLGFACLGICAALLLEFLYWSHNKRNAGVTEEEAVAKYGREKLALMGNRAPTYRYTY